MSNESVWVGIAPLPTVVQIPSYGDEPTERTEILIAFDDDYLYAAGRLYDSEPDQIRAPSKKRDYMGSDNDWFGLVLDTFNDNANHR
jgi:hypothetical protein